MAITLLVGTTKGAFLISGAEDRSDWAVRGPFCDLWTINHMAGDPETGRIWAAGGNDWLGAGVWRTEDGGENWTLAKFTKGQMDEWCENDPETAELLGFEPQESLFDDGAHSIWSVLFLNGKTFAGGKPAQLYVSEDGGETWQRNAAFENLEGREEWNGGAAGLTLHTIVPDPSDARKMWLGVSAAGVFATEDGGDSWERRNRLSNAEACEHHHHPAAPRNGQTGHCVHSVMRAPGDGDVLYQQNHHGVFRSSDGGRSWDDITEGLPSTFGFPIRVHPRDGQTIWTIPLNGDTQGRFPPGAAAAVWKSTDGGESWEARREGLPQSGCFFTVLRQAMAGDAAEPAGVYFGTNTGSVFASVDEGESWSEVARHLPTILSVDVLER